MSANFYDNSGKMAGVDTHLYQALLPPPTGTPIPFCPHTAAAAFSVGAAKTYLRTDTITSDSQKMIAGGFDNGPLLVHVPIPPAPPHPTEAAIFALLLANSTSTAQLTVGSVTGEGNALACCIYGAFGLNINCSDPIDMPCGVVAVINSVKTSPTLSDFVLAILGWIVNALFGFRVGKWIGKLKKLAIAIIKAIVRFAQDFLKWVFPKLAWLIEPLTLPLKALKWFIDWNVKGAKKIFGSPSHSMLPGEPGM